MANVIRCDKCMKDMDPQSQEAERGHISTRYRDVHLCKRCNKEFFDRFLTPVGKFWK